MVFECAAISPRAAAEVDQHRIAGVADDDVVGRNVAMQEVGFVNCFECVEQRRDDRVEFFLPRRAPQRLQPRLEALTFLEMQHHVGGVVRAENPMHLDDVAVIEPRERLRLVYETIEAPVVVACATVRPGRRLEVLRPRGEIAREILLDADLARQRRLIGEISDAEAARAEDAHDFIIARKLRAVR